MWAAYYELEPWGEVRGDLRAGIVASVIANVNRDPKKKGQPFKPTDFMPDYDGTLKEGKSSGRRAPLTDGNEWAKMKSRAKAVYGKKR